jgi:hypothetical protein
VQEVDGYSERTACNAGGVARSSVRYASVAAPQEPPRQRLYRDVGLTQQRQRPKQRRSAAPRVARMIPGAANERWAMDFIGDQLADGTAFRVLTMGDLYTRECVGLVPTVRV